MMAAMETNPLDGDPRPMTQNAIIRHIRRGTAVLLCAGVISGVGVGLVAPASQATVPPAVLESQGSFADLVERVSPAVVNVSSVRAGGPAEPEMPMTGTPFDEFFRRFGGPGFPGPGFEGPQIPGRPPGPQQRGEAVSMGSGFVIDASGYVVTNNHVVEGAEDISITLQDGTRIEAELVGADAKTDLALLKVSSDKPLPFVELGDSDKARVGDVVLAVGNPFGLGGTVTSGIISARSRNINSGPYDDFLQIDAAINRGNSGGPTFDTEGRVVGINTAIFSPSGGSVGIGFAIPSNLAKTVIAQLKEHGSVERGWIGVQIQPVTPDIAESLGDPDLKGALVAQVVPGGPAAEAGLQPGDVITSVAGEAVEDLRDVTRPIAFAKAGTEVDLSVLRQGRTETVEVALGRMPEDQQVASAREDAGPASSDLLGLDLASLDSRTRRELGLPDEVKGLVVTGSRNGANADKVRPGDVITAVGSETVETPAQLAEKAEKARKDGRKALLVRVHRQGAEQFVALEIERA
jgi:serine protease Do